MLLLYQLYLNYVLETFSLPNCESLDLPKVLP